MLVTPSGDTFAVHAQLEAHAEDGGPVIGDHEAWSGTLMGQAPWWELHVSGQLLVLRLPDGSEGTVMISAAREEGVSDAASVTGSSAAPF
jgi:hypothetical protein